MANKILFKIIIKIFFIITLTYHFGYCKTPSVLIDEQKNKIKLDKKIEYFLSKDNLSLEQARTKKFISHEKGVLNFRGHSSGHRPLNCWIHLRLKNESMTPKNIVLEIPYPLLHFVDFYGFETDRPQNIKMLKIGDKIPFNRREIKHRHFIFPLKIKKEMDVYIRVQASGAALTIPINIWPSNFSFFENDRKSHTFLCIYYGMLLVMVLYNLFIFILSRDKNYIYYVLCLISFMFLQLSMNGFNNEIWTNSPNWNSFNPLLFGALYLSTLLWFAKNYLNTKHDENIFTDLF